MTRILVTGARGLFGSSLVPHLRARGHEVLCSARKGHAEVCADLSSANQVDAALDKVAPDVIVNLAALANVDECERNPQLAYLANVRIVENLAAWIRRGGNVCHLVQISTDQVYDGLGPHREGNVTLTNYYAFSKYAGEMAAATVQSTVLRTNLFGPSRCPGRLSLSDWVVQSLTRGDPIRVFDDVRFSCLSLQRLVELVELVVVKRRQGVFNLGSKDGMSKADFAFALAEALGLPTHHISRGTSDEVKLSAYRPKDMRMDSSRFENAFGIALPTMREEIHSTKAEYIHEAG
jgi:dTDP-4-dehydrorhamnose reductase